MMRAAIFVDAGYFWVQSVHVIHGSKLGRDSITIDYSLLRQELLTQLSTQFPRCDLLRIYWYDGPGNHGKTAGHMAIESLDDFKLRLGTRNGAGDQKAVDGLIIADIIGLAQSKAISDALLLSGDADLTPGVIAAQGLGIRVHLLSIGPTNATSPFLRAEVDFKTHLDDALVLKFAKTSQTVPPIVTIATPVAQPQPIAATLPPGPLAQAAAAVHAAIQPAELASLTATGPIPKEIDAKLLREGFKTVARSLNDAEKRQLRAEFRRKLTV
jgi:uncharacterized LabA/DUF88 family protein